MKLCDYLTHTTPPNTQKRGRRSNFTLQFALVVICFVPSAFSWSLSSLSSTRKVTTCYHKSHFNLHLANTEASTMIESGLQKDDNGSSSSERDSANHLFLKDSMDAPSLLGTFHVKQCQTRKSKNIYH